MTKPPFSVIIFKHLRVRCEYREVEQLAARRAHNPEVVGSSPTFATKEERNYDTIFIVAFVFLYPKSLAV